MQGNGGNAYLEPEVASSRPALRSSSDFNMRLDLRGKGAGLKASQDDSIA